VSALPLTLVIVSTFLHAAWNILARYRGGAQTSIWRMQVAVVVIGAVPAGIGLMLLPCMSAKAALCVLGSGVCCGFYYVCLARAYEAGDFTTVYPAARALPVLLVGFGDALRGRPPSPAGWAGMALVAAGCLLVPLTSLRDFRPRHYWRSASLWIVLTALGTTGYSLLDKIGTESIPRGMGETAVYCYLYFAVAAASYAALRPLMARGAERREEAGWAAPAAAGILCYLAYWLVLCAYQMVERASYVIAFRQFSVVIGVVAAFVLFKEAGKAVRLAGTIAITAGMVLLKLFGSN
jgi:drug/metabolite transporter (DMT)-like permease